MNAEAKAIADRLTEAQRKAFKRGSLMGCCAPVGTGRAMMKKGLVEQGPGRDLFDWTPLGLAVRQALMEGGEG